MSIRFYDAVVIGSGFGGGAAALVLAQDKKRVLVLERGPWVARGPAAHDVDAILLRRDYASDVPMQATGPDGRDVDLRLDEAVGGRSVFYGAASLRFREEDFRARDRFPRNMRSELPSMDWPFGYDDLALYYTRAEEELRVCGVAGADPTGPRRFGRGYVAAPPAFGAVAQRLADAGERLGLNPFHIPLAIDFRRCLHCARCDQFPCPITAKNDIAVAVLPRAIAAGAEVQDRAYVTRIMTMAHGVTIDYINLETRRLETVHARAAFCAAGAIATPALLLRSGFPNPSIGRRLMRHCAGVAVGLFPFRTNPEQMFHKQVAFTDYYFGWGEERPAGPWGMLQGLHTPPPEYLAQVAPRGLGWLGAKTLPYQAYLLALAEDLPDINNSVTQSWTESDAYGVPRTIVSHGYHARDLAARAQLYRKAKQILARAGAQVRLTHDIHTYSHAVGTVRMGRSPRDSAADPYGRLWGTDSVFVVDGSTFPSSAGVNPSLTIMANALRIAEHAKREVVWGSST